MITDELITADKIPNIIWVDFADRFATDACQQINAVSN